LNNFYNRRGFGLIPRPNQSTMNAMTTPPDLAQAPLPVMVLGIPVHDVTFAETIAWAERHIQAGKPGYVATVNLDFILLAHRDPELQRILLEADLVVADGNPIVSLSGFLGPQLRERVTGSDLSPLLAEACARRGWSLFAMGGAPGVAEKATEVLRKRYPGLRIAGTCSPPLADLLSMDHADLLERLDRAQPSLLLLALGSPKQEKWINMHFRSWRVPLAIGVGGTLDFLAGVQKRAPRFAQRMGLEWLWRMATNPRRLFRRYFLDGSFFLASLARLAWIRYVPMGKEPPPPAEDVPAPARLLELGATILPWRSTRGLADGHALLQELLPLARRGALIFDLAGIPWLRSHELGLLVALNKAARANGHEAMAWHPGRRIERFIRATRLQDYVPTAKRAAEWLARLQALRSSQREGAASCTAAGTMCLLLPAELTAGKLAAYRAIYESALPADGLAAVNGWEIDASRLEFLDSAAMGFLAGLRKAAEDRGCPFVAMNWSDRARRILQVAHLDAVLEAPPRG
jgi:N-acetylglucosaminyldiphosphoundecaprenol N-acetyl-beta-D-mannosaminyltransferase